jgi:hypothetical protein
MALAATRDRAAAVAWRYSSLLPAAVAEGVVVGLGRTRTLTSSAASSALSPSVARAGASAGSLLGGSCGRTLRSVGPAGMVPAAALRGFHASPVSGKAVVGGEAPKAVALSKLKDSFLDGTSSSYLESLEEKYRRDPASVDRTWASFFRMQARQPSPSFPPSILSYHRRALAYCTATTYLGFRSGAIIPRRAVGPRPSRSHQFESSGEA